MSPLHPNIDGVIYFYIFICVSLLVFNLGYIFRSKGRSRTQQHRCEVWTACLTETLNALARTVDIAPEHRALLGRKLRSIQELMAYHEALEPRLGEPLVQEYLDRCHDDFQALAAVYCRRPPMERAFFAYLIALYHPDRGREHDQLAELLLAFLDDSTVYCRENVLRALCALGNAGGVEHALSRFHDQGWYHHARLLSDGLMTFAGDREALARRLWTAAAGWNESLQVAVVQFVTNLPADFSDLCLPALRAADTLPETRFALIRYFQRHPNDLARPALLDLASGGEAAGGGPAIAVCAALAQYPGDDTKAVLEAALHSRNWYIRRNAASSLVTLGVTERDLQDVERGGDRYAREMLVYMTRLRYGEGVGV